MKSLASSHTTSANILRTSSNTFKLTELDHDSVHPEYWRARLDYRTFQGRKANVVASVVLQREATGSVIFDTGRRGKGARWRLKQAGRDLHKAVEFAERELEKIAHRMIAAGDMDRAVAASGGDCTIPEIRHVYFSIRQPGKQIGTEYARNLDNTFDWLLEANGPQFTVGRIDQKWVDLMIEIRMSTIRFTRVDRPAGRNVLEGCGWNTAVKNMIAFCSAVALAHQERDENGLRYQEINPFSSETVKIPALRPPKRKQNFGMTQYVRLMTPVVSGGEIRLAPVDRADPTGQTRLMQAAFFHFGVRRGQLRIAKRGHIALTPDEIRTTIELHAQYIVHEEWHRFVENGLWLFDGEDGKMRKRGAVHYTRPLPIPRALREEVEHYFDRNPIIRSARPDAPLFPAPGAPHEPVSEATCFMSPRYAYQTDSSGNPLLDSKGQPMWLLDANGEPVLPSRAKGGRAGGRFARAIQFAREDLQTSGEDWKALFPYERGTMVHAWRGHLEKVYAALNYLTKVVDERGAELDLARHVDYFLMRKMSDAVRFENYIPLDVDVLLGMAELQDAREVLAARISRLRMELAAAKQDIAEGRKMLAQLTAQARLHTGADTEKA